MDGRPRDGDIHLARLIRIFHVKTARIHSPFYCQNYALRKGDHRPLIRPFSLEEITFPSGLADRWRKVREKVRTLMRSRS